MHLKNTISILVNLDEYPGFLDADDARYDDSAAEADVKITRDV